MEDSASIVSGVQAMDNNFNKHVYNDNTTADVTHTTNIFLGWKLVPPSLSRLPLKKMKFNTQEPISSISKQ